MHPHSFGVCEYGKVDNLPEAPIFVATRFFHIMFLPIIPLGSDVVIETAGGEWRGVNIPLSPKSALAAYMRAWLIVLPMIVGIFGLLFFFATQDSDADGKMLGKIMLPFWMLVPIGFLSYTKSFRCASSQRAEEIRKALAEASPEDRAALDPYLPSDEKSTYYVKMYGVLLHGLRRHPVRGRATLVLHPSSAVFVPRSPNPTHGGFVASTEAHRLYCDEEQRIVNMAVPDGSYVVFTFFDPKLVGRLKSIYGSRYERVNLPTHSFLSRILG